MEDDVGDSVVEVEGQHDEQQNSIYWGVDVYFLEVEQQDKVS